MSAALLGVACAPLESDDANIAVSSSRLVHGADDRLDVDAVESPLLRSLALDSTLALVSSAALHASPDEDVVTFDAPDLATAEHLCSGQAFSDQPTLARCAGVLVDDDLALTVGHCAAELEPCERQRWVFEYALAQGERMPKLRRDSIYRCRAIPVVRYEETSDGTRFDYALVQLDRAVSPERIPVVIADAPALTGEPLCVIGFPSGLPIKVDCGARALDPRGVERDYLRLTSDTFRGSSGSGVFDAVGELVAVLARGGADYDFAAGESCRVARQLSDPPPLTVTEQASYAAPAIQGLCDAGWASQRLCARASRCGDGQCSLDEHSGACASDCPAQPAAVSELTSTPASCHVAGGERGPGGALWLLFACGWIWRRAAKRVSTFVEKPE